MSTSGGMTVEVATPERVSVSLPVAGIGYRSLAYLIDLSVLFAFWLALYFALSFLRTSAVEAFQALSGLGQSLAVLGLFFAQWVYWTACEVLGHGQTLGKRALRIRVVREDGSAVGVLESAIRNLCRAVDFLPLLYATGVLCMLLTARHRRIGDLVAGTLLIRDERIDLDRYTAAPAGPPSASASALAAAEVELILGYLERAPSLAPEARQRLAASLVERFGGEVAADERTRLKGSIQDAEAFLQRRARAGT